MRKRLLLTYLSLIAIGISITGVFSLVFTRQNYLEMVQERLYDNGRIIRQYAITDGIGSSLDELCKDVGHRFGMRMTIILSDGTVIGDSDAEPIIMGNHLNRPEIKSALNGEIGRAIRYSATLETDMMYIAIPENINGQKIILRMAMPLKGIYDNVRIQWRNILITLVIAFIVALYQGNRFSIFVTKPILEMAELSDKIAGGDFDRRIKVKVKDEMARLADALNSMAENLQNTIGDLRDKNLKLEAILASMINGIIALDIEHHIILINPAAEKIFNIEGKVIGKYFLEVLRDSQIDRLIQEILVKGNTSSVETTIWRNGESSILKINGAPMEDRKGIIGMVLLIQDITELRRLEQVRKDFVANVSHELKTPLTSIQGFIETLQNGAMKNPKTAERFLNIMELEADRLSRLINDILSLSELESGKGNLLVEKINLVEIIQDTIEVMKPHARNKQISIGYLFARHLIYIKGSKDRVKQMIINLIDNAVKYTEEGGSITVLVEDLEDKIILRVRDTGVGIAKEHIPRLFERFYRVDKGRSRGLGGTGLGLAIVKHIVLSMKGRIEVSSELGKGSEFIIHIPKDI